MWNPEFATEFGQLEGKDGTISRRAPRFKHRPTAMEHFADVSLPDMADNIIDQKLLERAARIHDQTLCDKNQAEETSPSKKLLFANQAEMGESDVDSANSSQIIEQPDERDTSNILTLFEDIESQSNSSVHPRDSTVVVPDFDQFKSIEDKIVAITSPEQQAAAGSHSETLLEERLQAVASRKTSVSALLDQFNPKSKPSTSPQIFRKFSRTRLPESSCTSDATLTDCKTPAGSKTPSAITSPDIGSKTSSAGGAREPPRTVPVVDVRNRAASAPGVLPRGNRFARKERLPHVYYRTAAPTVAEIADTSAPPISADDGGAAEMPRWKRDLLARRQHKKQAPAGGGGVPLGRRFRHRAQTTVVPVPPDVSPNGEAGLLSGVHMFPDTGLKRGEVTKPTAGASGGDAPCGASPQSVAMVTPPVPSEGGDGTAPMGAGSETQQAEAFGVWGLSRRPSVAELTAQHSRALEQVTPTATPTATPTTTSRHGASEVCITDNAKAKTAETTTSPIAEDPVVSGADEETAASSAHVGTPQIRAENPTGSDAESCAGAESMPSDRGDVDDAPELSF
eukprot:m.1575503 g.1575503  ORF g.1575503 m.1575503 type:complete len:567 (+) comp25308_c0_seq42:374-2074(+)